MIGPLFAGGEVHRQAAGGLRAQFDRTSARRTYITGGMGSRHMDEAFGEDFELPPDVACCKTCAGVAAVHLAQRLLL